MKTPYLVLAMVLLSVSPPLALAQFWPRRGLQYGDAAGADASDGFEDYEIVETRRPYIPPPVGPAWPAYFTAKPVNVPSARTPSERDFDTREGSFAAPQVVVHPDSFSGSEIRDVAFSPDGRHLAVAGDVVRIWDIESQRLIRTLWGQREYGGIGSCTSVAYSPDGRYFVAAVAGHNASLRVYNTQDLSEIKEVYGGHAGHVVHLAFSRDGRFLATAGVDRYIHIWDWPQRKKAASYLMDGPVLHLDFPSAGDNVFAIIRLDKDWMPFYWSLSTDAMSSEPDRETLYRLVHNSLPIQSGNFHLRALQVRCDGERAIYGIYDRAANGGGKFRCTVWNGSRLLAQHNHPYFVSAVAYHAGRNLVASGDALGQIHVWSATTGEDVASFSSGSLGIYSVEFDGSGRLRFGRNPYRARAGWKLNHYAPLTHYLDLVRQETGRTPRNPAAADSPRPSDSLGNLRVSLSADQVLSLEREGTKVSSINFGRSTESRPITCGLLRGNDLGFTPAVIAGFNNGTLAAYDPETLQLKRSFFGHTGQVWCFSQSPDGRLLATGSGDNTIRIWRLAEGRELGNLSAYVDSDGTVFDLVPGTPASAVLRTGDRVLKIDGKRLTELADDFAATGQWPYAPGRRAIVEYQSGGQVKQTEIELSSMGDIVEPLITIRVSDDGRDWIAWTPRGYYMASSGGDGLIGWQENQGRHRAAKFYSADQFRDRFERADIVLEVLETAELDEAVQLANAAIVRPPAPADIREDMPELRPPVIRILSPVNGQQFDSPDITVRVEITATAPAPLRELCVSVNGHTFVERDIVRGRIVAKAVRLAPGENRISASARAASIGRSDMVTVTCTPFEVRRDLYVVALGVSQYKSDGIQNLQFAATDARQFVQAMERQKERGCFSRVHKRLLTDDAASRSDAVKAISWLINSARANDVIAFFVSAHGLIDNAGNYFVATHDADPDDPLLTCLEWKMMETLVQSVPSRVLLFIDTCHAGGILGGRAMPYHPYRNLHSPELGAFVFAATGPNEAAFEHRGNGIFTRAFLDILDDPEYDRDVPADEYLSFTELFNALDRRVRLLSKHTQTPYIEMPQGLGRDVTLFRLPARALN